MTRRTRRIALAVAVGVAGAGAWLVTQFAGTGSQHAPAAPTATAGAATPPAPGGATSAPNPMPEPLARPSLPQVDPLTGMPNFDSGDVAVTVPVQAPGGATPPVRPGYHVDLIVDALGNGHAAYAFQDCQVLRVSGAGNGAVITVALHRDAAAHLAWIALVPGSPGRVLAVAIRGLADWGRGQIPDPGVDGPLWAAGGGKT